MAIKARSGVDLIAEMHKDIKEIKEVLIPNMHREIAILKIKNTIWSGATGLLGGVLAVLGIKLGN